MKTKFINIILIFLVTLSGCNNYADQEQDNKCKYETTEEYDTALNFDVPLFYNQFDSYNYNGVNMNGFYILGETKGSKTIATLSKSSNNYSPGSSFIANDTYNTLYVLEMNDEDIDKFEYLEDISIVYQSNIYHEIENDIIHNLIYEYYENYFDELNQFLNSNNVLSFWDLEQMKCERTNALSSIPLTHPNVNEYIHLDIYVQLRKEHVILIANSITENNLSIKTNPELKTMIEELVESNRIYVNQIQVTLAGELIENDENFDYVIKYNSDGRDFNEDITEILGRLDNNLVEAGLGIYTDDYNYRTRAYYINYENGYQIGWSAN